MRSCVEILQALVLLAQRLQQFILGLCVCVYRKSFSITYMDALEVTETLKPCGTVIVASMVPNILVLTTDLHHHTHVPPVADIATQAHHQLQYLQHHLYHHQDNHHQKQVNRHLPQQRHQTHHNHQL